MICTPHQISFALSSQERDGWSMHYVWDRRRAYAALVGRPEGKRPLGRPRHRWENNSNMDLQEVGMGGTDCINLAQDTDRWQALVNVVMNQRVQSMEGNF